MSSSPLRPLAYPAQRQLSSTTSTNPLGRSTGDASTSASSSVTAGGAGQSSKADQVVYRFYVKTVGVLVEGRLTHYASGGSGKTGEKKKDKWFNLSLPEVDLHNADLQIYRSVSTYNNPKSFLDESSIPPLLIAFILDTSDIPNGQALVWNRESGKYTVDNALLASGGPKGKGKETEQKNGIILERWTIRARNSVEAISASQMAPHTAYRLGIIHFRALYSLIRLLPVYRLFRRLRRINSGIRVGIKLWGPEGYPNTDEGLAEAWEVMERGLISLDTSLSDLVPSDQSPPDDSERCDLPPLDMFGTTYAVNVEYRPEVDFSVEDLESVLSERFVDMDEDWFKPTVARHRMEDEHGRGLPAEIQSNRRTSNPTAIPSTSPIPSRQQAATPQSFGSAGAAFSSGRPTGSRVASGVGTSVGKGSAGSRWGALGEGLPFAAPRMSGSGSEAPRGPPSPGGVTPSSVSGAAVTARRLSGHSIHPPMSSSPSTSLLRSTPPGVHPAPLMSRPSTSIGRTSSFLSQSGRSFTHAQLANMSPHLSSSPPVQTPVSPSSLSFTKQPVPRSFSGRQYAPTGSSSPFVPGSLEKDQVASTQSSLSAAPPMQVLKRYSSSLSQRPGVTVGSATSSEERALAGSIGASGGSATHNLLRRTSTRTSQESALRQSSIAPAPDHEDIQAFLKTLDALPHPPSLAAHAVHSSTRSHVPSTSSSLSTPSVPPSPLPVQNVSGSPGSMGPPPVPRAPLTRTLVDEALKRMAGSFDITTSRLVESTAPRTRTPDIGNRPGPSTSSSGSAGPSVGLLTASRPTPPRTASRPDPPQSPENPGSRPEYRRQNSVKTGSPLASSPAQLPLPESPSVNVQPSPRNTLYRLPSARSLPGSGSAALNPDEPLPRSAIPSMPSGFSDIGYSAASQTTGYGQGMATAESRTSRRGPVLLRGGFEGRSTITGVTGGSPGHGGHGRPSASSSPSHSPIRDFNRLTLSRPSGAAAGTPSGSGNPTTAPITGTAGFGNRGESMSLGYSTRKQPGQRTAPSSYGAPEVDDADDRGRARRAARKSDGGPMGVEGARSGSEIDEGSGKEERVRPVHKRSGLSGDW